MLWVIAIWVWTDFARKVISWGLGEAVATSWYQLGFGVLLLVSMAPRRRSDPGQGGETSAPSVFKIGLAVASAGLLLFLAWAGGVFAGEGDWVAWIHLALAVASLGLAALYFRQRARGRHRPD